MEPWWNGVIFFALNIILVCGLLFMSVIFAFSHGPVMRALKRWEPETEPGRFYTLRRLFRLIRINRFRIGAFLLFFFGAISHTIVAMHVILHIPLVEAGALGWYMHAVRLPQAIGIWMLISGISPKKLRKQKKSDIIDT